MLLQRSFDSLHWKRQVVSLGIQLTLVALEVSSPLGVRFSFFLESFDLQNECDYEFARQLVVLDLIGPAH